MTTPTQEKIDLSHYDLKNDFLLYEAACLIAGIDPYAQKLNDLCISPESTRVQTTLAAMHEAHKSAATAFTDMAFSFEITSDRRPVYDPWSIKKEQGEPMPPVLPSINMHDWLYCFKRYRDASKLNLRISPSKDKFKREDITKWLQAKGYKQACYFIDSDPDDAGEERQEVGKTIIPDWFKPYVTRSYLSITEAGSIIAPSNFTGPDEDFGDELGRYEVMLREHVKEGLINLSIDGGSVIDDESYWRLDVQDIRRLCHNSGLAWPIPWQEEPDQPLSTESAKLQEQVKRLQEQVKQFESQAKELEILKQENAELKAKIEALSDGQNPDTPSQDIDPRLKNTLYKMIYAMAKDCYKYDPRAPRNDATNDIYLAIADAKLSLGKDAIREHLKESAKLAS